MRFLGYISRYPEVLILGRGLRFRFGNSLGESDGQLRWGKQTLLHRCENENWGEELSGGGCGERQDGEGQPPDSAVLNRQVSRWCPCRPVILFLRPCTPSRWATLTPCCLVVRTRRRCVPHQHNVHSLSARRGSSLGRGSGACWQMGRREDRWPVSFSTWEICLLFLEKFKVSNIIMYFFSFCFLASVTLLK